MKEYLYLCIESSKCQNTEEQSTNSSQEGTSYRITKLHPVLSLCWILAISIKLNLHNHPMSNVLFAIFTLQVVKLKFENVK